MFQRTRTNAIALVAIGGLLGFAAASGKFNPARWASDAQGSSNASAAQSAEPAKPSASCCDVLNKGELAAIAAHNQKVAAKADKTGKKPNILVIWGDDIGIHNISAYNHGIMGYRTPNIDRLAHEGALFTDAYAQQSCTAGRASFILGQHPFRTGLLTIGFPGSPHGIPDWTPTIADLLKEQGYATGQFGKNHLGDLNKHLPTVHGFDEFFGNLYHLNAEEEPEGYYYPKDPAFKKKFGPRGVLHSFASDKDDPTVDGRSGPVGKQTITDTGPLNRSRMPTIDEELFAGATKFIDKSVNDKKPFFVWFCTTRMHVWTHLKKESDGVTGIGLYPDGMVEHDKMVGDLLKKLDDLGIADNTIVVYGTDNGPETMTWPDGGITPFHGEKGTTWEGGFRVPMIVRWPGVIKPGTDHNEIFSQEDWMPTLLAAAGEPDVVSKLESKDGYKANGKSFRIHPDGYNFLPYWKGDAPKAPREEILYFDQDGNLNAVRWSDWKVNFASVTGNMVTGVRLPTNFPLLVNLKADPYEKMPLDSMMYMRWMADNIWIYVPIGGKIRQFLGTIPDYPFQESSGGNPSGINYNSLKAAGAMQKLRQLEQLANPHN
ncbi:MAG TPA: arylsulfatase [Gemmataceae bacterium]|nr:arylsulfatase [Gemmataceae bacterium]